MKNNSKIRYFKKKKSLKKDFAKATFTLNSNKIAKKRAGNSVQFMAHY